ANISLIWFCIIYIVATNAETSRQIFLPCSAAAAVGLRLLFLCSSLCMQCGRGGIIFPPGDNKAKPARLYTQAEMIKKHLYISLQYHPSDNHVHCYAHQLGNGICVAFLTWCVQRGCRLYWESTLSWCFLTLLAINYHRK
uniref:Uncharacterized protein n=1 Tax=Takifugu rubripes TaxID=31033 RepID=A0A674NLX4_TAKRU